MSRVTGTLSSGTVVELTNGRHTWSADEPIEVSSTTVPDDNVSVFFVTVMVVPTATYILLPRFTRLFESWLFA